MNTGAFGENFPYSNFHDLNTDWIIKIAKDFLDQYTHIQEVITNGEESLQNLTTVGLEQLQTKADELEDLLQQWYNTHSEDIANQLAEAVADLNTVLETNTQTFNARADEKLAQVLEDIPTDYTELTKMVSALRHGLIPSNAYNIIGSGKAVNTNYHGINYSFDENRNCTVTGTASGRSFCNLYDSTTDELFIPIEAGETYYLYYDSTNVFCRIFALINGNAEMIANGNTSRRFKVPDNATGIIVRYDVSDGVTVNETVPYPIISKETTDHSQTSLGVLADGKNLNTIADGWYLLIDANTYTNAPFTAGFVLSKTFDNTAMQIGISFSTYEVYIRRAINSNWGTWSQYASGLESRVIALETLATGSLLPDGSDLNAIADGWYLLIDANTYTNAPVLPLFLYQKSIDNTKLQFGVDFNTRNLYFRRCLNTTWLDWNHMTGINNKVRVAVFGDSIVWGRDGASSERVAHPLTDFIWYYSRHIETANYGVGGMGWLEKVNNQNAYDKLIATDLSNFNAVAMCYGLNDYTLPMGEYTDTGTTTMMGIIYNCFNYLRTNYPSIIPILIGIPNSCSHTEISFPEWDWYRVRAGGWSDETFDQECKKFCDYYHVPYISLKQSPINSFNIANYLPDGIHPNQNGYELLGSFLRSQLENILGE